MKLLLCQSSDDVVEQDMECALDLAQMLEIEIDIHRVYIDSTSHNALLNQGCYHTPKRDGAE